MLLGHVKRNRTLSLLHLTFPSVNSSALFSGTCTRLGEGSWSPGRHSADLYQVPLQALF